VTDAGTRLRESPAAPARFPGVPRGWSTRPRIPRSARGFGNRRTRAREGGCSTGSACRVERSAAWRTWSDFRSSRAAACDGHIGGECAAHFIAFSTPSRAEHGGAMLASCLHRLRHNDGVPCAQLPSAILRSGERQRDLKRDRARIGDRGTRSISTVRHASGSHHRSVAGRRTRGLRRPSGPTSFGTDPTRTQDRPTMKAVAPNVGAPAQAKDGCFGACTQSWLREPVIYRGSRRAPCTVHAPAQMARCCASRNHLVSLSGHDTPSSAPAPLVRRARRPAENQPSGQTDERQRAGRRRSGGRGPFVPRPRPRTARQGRSATRQDSDFPHRRAGRRPLPMLRAASAPDDACHPGTPPRYRRAAPSYR
jgi:hypothetical protein